ncbi:MAG: serine hydrolase domain-containing protein [bacterium]
MTNILQPYIDRGELAGAVTLVANAEKILSLKCIGYADIAAKIPMQPNTMFWIASQSKPITCTALMMLVDDGKVCVDDPVEKYLPEFKSMWLSVERDDEHILLKRPSRLITVRDILSHTSGMGFMSALEVPTLDLQPLRECSLSYAMTPLSFEPGTKYEYANTGINTVGRIIEVVSGMPYEEFLQTRMFKPLRMIDTTFVPNDEQMTRMTKCYQPNADRTGLEEVTISQLKYPFNDKSRKPMPAGGLFSTATDCGHFMQMVLNDGIYEGKRYLSTESIKQMTSKQTGELADEYGFGWASGENYFGHGGACATNMAAHTKEGIIIVYLIQETNGFLGDGGMALETFVKDAREKYS